MPETYADITRVPQGPPGAEACTLRLRFSYDAPAVAWLKAHIPSYDRTWSDAEKAWYVKPRHLDWLQVFVQAFDTVMLIDGTTWHDLKTGRSYEYVDGR